MSNLSDITPAPSKSNPHAASMRLQSKTMNAAYGQRRHDLRIGAQPNYVDQGRNDLNRVLIEPRRLPDIRNEIIDLRKRRGAQRALKSNAAIVKSGIVTFGVEAAKLFNMLPDDRQDEAFLELAQLLAERLNTRLESLVVHLDETTIHAHFELRAFAGDGQPICKSMDRAAMSEFQDMTAAIMQRYCPEIERGNRKQNRLDAGANYADTLNRSVRQLHENLPIEIADKEQELRDLDAGIAIRQSSIEKDKKRILDLETRENLNAKEEKRLGVYRARLAKKETTLQNIVVQLREKHADINNRQVVVTKLEIINAEATKVLKSKSEDTALKKAEAIEELGKARYAKGAYKAGIRAVETIVDEMANNTIRETQDEIILQNPEPILAAPKPVQERLTKIVHQYLDMQSAWAKRRAWLDEMVGKVKWWLGRDDLSQEARNDGDSITTLHDNGPDV